MRIPCPYCGERGLEEFSYHGDATRHRPEAEAGLDAFVAYVYERDNPTGSHQEHWYHAGGCRRWLVVTRDVTTHAVRAAVAARAPATGGSKP